MRASTLLVALLGLLCAMSADAADLPKIASRAIAAREKMMQADATAADVDAFMTLCTDDLVYEDPVVHMRIQGKEQIRAGMAAFLGATRRARIAITRSIAVANVVVLDQLMSFEEKDEASAGRWKPSKRHQVTIIELDGDRIRRIADYWAR